MFDVGFQELLLVFVIGLLILGPERLPRVAAQLGRWVAKARRTANQLRYQLEREVALEEIYKTQKKKPPSRPGTTAPGTTDAPGTAASATGTEGAAAGTSKAGGTEAPGASTADAADQAARGSSDAAASRASEPERAAARSPATAAEDATTSAPANAEALVSGDGAAGDAEEGEFRQSGNAR